MYFIQHCPSVSTVSEDAGIEPRTVATLALALTQTLEPKLARSHPQLFQISFTTRPELIHNSVESLPHSARSHLKLGQISSSTRLDLIQHNLARSHPQLGQNSSLLGLISSTTRLQASSTTQPDLIHNSARSNTTQLCQISYYTTWLDLILHNLARSHPQLGQISSTLGQISSTTRLGLIHKSARPHPQLGQTSSSTRLDLIRNSDRPHKALGQI